MHIIIYILGLTLLFRVGNYYRVKLLTLKTENKFAELKYKLQILYLDKKVKRESELFHHLYVSIGNMESGIRRLNIWMVFYIMIRERINKNNGILQLESKIKYNPNISGDCEMKNIHDELYKITHKYIFRKSIFSLFIGFVVIKIAKKTSASCYRWIAEVRNKIDEISIVSQNQYEWA